MITDRFCNLPGYLSRRSTIIFNNTRVICARILFRKKTGALIEIFCLSPAEPADYQKIFAQTENCSWYCMVGNLRKWKNSTLSCIFTVKGKTIELVARKENQKDNLVKVGFSWNGGINFSTLLNHAGNLPLPPYLKREPEEQDKQHYQTVFSKFKGSVAAPTAGLHFTPPMLDTLRAGHLLLETTLHVGAGTFQPVKENNAIDHIMHEEIIIIEKSFIKALLHNDQPVIAVGTTSVRTLESIYWLGVKVLKNDNISAGNLRLDQWEWRETALDVSVSDSLNALLNVLSKNDLERLVSSTRLMIIPGYTFKMADGLITNFHLPKSTLLLLVAAFIGEDWRKIYSHALKENFRFLSYGDSSLLLRDCYIEGEEDKL